MEITLKIKDNIYKETEIPAATPQQAPTIKRKLVKKNVITNITIESNDIVLVSEIINEKGNVLKDFCRIHVKEIGPIVVNHSRNYINKIKQHNARPIGFKRRD